MSKFQSLAALYINSSLNGDEAASHTSTLMDHSIAVILKQGVAVERIHAREHRSGWV